ncbi:hypothetical protein TTRE_0000233801 [Trichuris trichiura]|uniref:Uncharacterized protein n=1 Tax=Trichuris trichiura TaxID=36087 RepID=A0A077Z2G1_TRITR|nr:hypothetical protein TTRE_0000233801 [Trichuris trichiura]
MNDTTFTHFVAYKVPDMEQLLEKRLHWESDRFACSEYNIPGVLKEILGHQVIDFAVGPSHIAFLTASMATVAQTL